jgi:hypothetical protein
MKFIVGFIFGYIVGTLVLHYAVPKIVKWYNQ